MTAKVVAIEASASFARRRANDLTARREAWLGTARKMAELLSRPLPDAATRYVVGLAPETFRKKVDRMCAARGMRIAAYSLALAFLWTQAATADQFDARAGQCRDDAGRFMPCSEVADPQPVPIVDPLPTGPAPGYEPEKDSDFAMDAGLGVVASLSSEASSGEPTAEVGVSFDVATNPKSPRLSLLARFGALPGETVSFSDPTTFRSLGIEGTLSQPLWSNLRIRPAVMLGAEFRFSGDEQPLHRAARYGYLGARVEGEDGYLFLGLGGDERLSTSDRSTPAYLPATAVSWSLRIGNLTGKIDARLVGRVLLYLRMGYGASDAGSDVAQLGVLVSVGGKR